VTGVLIAWAAIIGVIVVLALVLPCKGCKLRRDRLQRTYEEWKTRRAGH